MSFAIHRFDTRMPIKGRSDDHGFTLIELLVVIAIIVLLVSILVPSLYRAKALAKLLVCSTNLHAIGQAGSMYAADNHNFIPRDYWYKYDSLPDDPEEGHYFFAAKFVEYLGGEKIPVGPGGPGSGMEEDEEMLKEVFKTIGAYHCPEVEDENYVLHYVSNGVDFDYYKKTGGNWSGVGGAASPITSLPASPSSIAYLMEANMSSIPYTWFGLYDFLTDKQWMFLYDEPNSNSRVITADDTRHIEKTPVAFFDGHVENKTLGLDEFPITLMNPLVGQ